MFILSSLNPLSWFTKKQNDEPKPMATYLPDEDHVYGETSVSVNDLFEEVEDSEPQECTICGNEICPECDICHDCIDGDGGEYED